MIEPRIEISFEKKLIGKSLRISLFNNRTKELWQSFMPLRKQIKQQVSPDLFCLQVYDPSYSFQNFDSHAEFEKWAAVEVQDFTDIPGQMKTFVLESGLYAVFIHIGAAARGPETFQYIFGTWLPASDYLLDNRPHFEILGAKYINDHPDSEEEIWIPIKQKI